MIAPVDVAHITPAGAFYLIQLGKTSGSVRSFVSSERCRSKATKKPCVFTLKSIRAARILLQWSIITVYFKGQFKGENYDLGSPNKHIRQS